MATAARSVCPLLVRRSTLVVVWLVAELLILGRVTVVDRAAGINHRRYIVVWAGSGGRRRAADFAIAGIGVVDAEIRLALGCLERRGEEAVLVDRDGVAEPGQRAVVVVE